ncbi:hypothetical protein B566_EDAN011397 [Ephemera danica]|nr:hypothetical protein B566_EDAN011397 [Ephemera danica]
MIKEDKILAIGDVLNSKLRPMKERFRALFTLKNIGGPISVSCIQKCFVDDSALLKHELAYCLGQMQDPEAIPILESVLRDVNQEPMVRHEAAEALGAIGRPEVIETLEEFAKDPTVSVAETCHLALRRIAWLKENKTVESSDQNDDTNPYFSIDPTPAATDNNIRHLRNGLLDDSADLYDRYKSLFALRNLRTPEAALVLAGGLKSGGALFRHEVAFVLGQLQEPTTVAALIEGLEDKSQDEMVRHECAEALGAIATPQALTALQQHLGDEKQVVRESCEASANYNKSKISTFTPISVPM